MMPKRKRDQGVPRFSEDARLSGHKDIAAMEFSRGKKELTRALKLAKGFERQKLGRRYKIALSESKSEVCGRIEMEIKALKVTRY
jgi:hypothetical protein